jgi:hypothetical protein
MKLLLKQGLSAAAGLIISAGVLASNDFDGGARAPEGCAGQAFDLSFVSPDEAFVFQLTPFDKGKIVVTTSDCCAFGPDIWRTEIHEVYKNGKSKPGNGDVDVWSGKNIKGGVKVGKSYQLVVSPDDVAAGYGAGMSVCVEGPVSITPLP